MDDADVKRLKALPSRRVEIESYTKLGGDGVNPGYQKEISGEIGPAYQKAAESAAASMRTNLNDPRVQFSAIGQLSNNYQNNTVDIGKRLCEERMPESGYVPGTILLSFGKITEQVKVKTGFLKKEMQERPEAAENYVKGGGAAPAFYVNVMEVSVDDPVKCGPGGGRSGLIGKTMFMSEQDGQKLVQEIKSNLESKNMQQRQAYVKSFFSDVMKKADVEDPKGNLAKSAVIVGVDNMARYSNTNEIMNKASEITLVSGRYVKKVKSPV